MLHIKIHKTQKIIKMTFKVQNLNTFFLNIHFTAFYWQ